MMTTTHRTTWIIGCGDIGLRVAALHAPDNFYAVVHSNASQKKCQALTRKTFQVDLDDDFPEELLDHASPDIFYFAPPVSEGKTDTRLPRFLDKLGKNARRIVLISTTGVYGDSQGAWIDETTAVAPQADRAHRRLSTEQALIAWAEKHDREYMILRVPGIYAIERLPLERLNKQLPVINAAKAGYTNRIHADDLAQACYAAMHCDAANEIINTTDGSPSTMTDYFNLIADYAGLPRPPQISLEEAQATLSPGMVSYMRESRRIKNEKMLRLLKIKLHYPNLKATLMRAR